jgi:hypothetical protein
MALLPYTAQNSTSGLSAGQQAPKALSSAAKSSELMAPPGLPKSRIFTEA